MAIQMKIHNKYVMITIDNMICHDCFNRYKNKGDLQILSCRKFVSGKPYDPVLLKNRCLYYSSEDEEQIVKIKRRKKK